MYEVTNRIGQLLNQSEKSLNVILKIEGYDKLLSVTDVYELLSFVSAVPIPVGTVFGSKVKRDDVYKLISLEGTTQSISQSVEPDKGVGQATSNITVRLVDVNSAMTRLISPAVVLPDVLYRKTRFYIGFNEGIFPQDYNLVFSGVITSIKSGPTTIDLTISHPDEIKRTDVFKRAESKLIQAVDYFSTVIGPLSFTQKSDYVGTVSIEIINSGGPSGSISVSGGAITLFGVSGTTTFGRLKELIEGDVEASQLVTVVATGDRNDTIFVQALTVLSSSSEIFLETVDGFLLPNPPLFKTYVRIADELIEYTTVDPVLNKLSGLTRSQLNSIGTVHKINASVKTFYVFGDGINDTLELAKYLLLSGGPEFYLENIEVNDIVSLPDGLSGPNALFFRNKFLESEEGVLSGDTLTLTLATNPANNVTAPIEQIFEYETGTFIQLDNSVSLVSESPSTAVAKFESQYNILPDGAGCTPDQIDLEQFLKIKNRFSNGLAKYEFYLKDTVKVKEFLEKELFYPSGLYSVPRKGKISCQYTAPAIFDGVFNPLDKEAVINPQNILIERQTGKFFYNTVVYRYEEDSITERFLRGRIDLSTESTARIPAPTKPLNLYSKGLRDTTATTALIQTNSFRLLSRYKYGSESMDVQVSYRVGGPLEIGDAVQFGDESFMLPDTSTGIKRFKPRIFEIVNKDQNWRTGEIKLKIVDTAFLGRRRYGLFSPTSRCDTGSTTNKLVLKQFYSPNPTRKEYLKWINYIGKQIMVRSTDSYTTSTNEVRTIVGFDAVDEGSLFIAPPLGFTPDENSIVQIPNYSGAGITEALVEGYKARYVYWDPTVEVGSVVATTSTETVLDVGADSSKFFVGSIVRVHSKDYTYDSGQTQYLVTVISGSEIEIKPALPSGVASGQFIDLIGFVSDQGDPYAWL